MTSGEGERCLNDQRALFLLMPDNCFRSATIRIVNSKAFFIFILVAIIANSLLLAINQPRYPISEEFQDTVYWLEVAFVSIFGLEMLLKVCALGLVLHQDSYLRDPWNVFDCLVVIVSIIALVFNQKGIAVIRLFRVLRPLRTISHIKRLKSLLNALFISIPAVTTNFLFLVAFIFLSALIGLHSWAGNLSNRCYYPPASPFAVQNSSNAVILPTAAYNASLYSNLSDWQLVLGTLETRCGGFFTCPGDGRCLRNTTVFRDEPQSFETIWSALLLVLKVTTLDNWFEDMQKTVNSSGVWTIGYFVVITLFAGFFLLNVFLAILMSEYNVVVAKMRAKKERKDRKKNGKGELRRRGSSVVLMQGRNSIVSLDSGGRQRLGSGSDSDEGGGSPLLSATAAPPPAAAMRVVQDIDDEEDVQQTEAEIQRLEAEAADDVPDMDTVVVDPMELRILQRFYALHAPERVDSATSLLLKYHGKTGQLFTAVEERYQRWGEAAKIRKELEEEDDEREKKLALVELQQYQTEDEVLLEDPRIALQKKKDSIAQAEEEARQLEAEHEETEKEQEARMKKHQSEMEAEEKRYKEQVARHQREQAEKAAFAEAAKQKAKEQERNAKKKFTTTEEVLKLSMIPMADSESSSESSSDSDEDGIRVGRWGRIQSMRATANSLGATRTFGKRFDDSDSDSTATWSGSSSSDESSSDDSDEEEDSSTAASPDESGAPSPVVPDTPNAPGNDYKFPAESISGSSQKYVVAAGEASGESDGKLRSPTGSSVGQGSAGSQSGSPLKRRQSSVAWGSSSDDEPQSPASQKQQGNNNNGSPGGGSGGAYVIDVGSDEGAAADEEETQVLRSPTGHKQLRNRNTVDVLVGSGASKSLKKNTKKLQQKAMIVGALAAGSKKAAGAAKPKAAKKAKTDGEGKSKEKKAKKEKESDLAMWRRKAQGPITVFVFFMILVTLLNIAILAADHYGIDPELENMFNIIGFVCAILYAIELILKCVGFGFLPTFKDKFNLLDLFLVVVAAIEFFVQTENGVGREIQVLRALRAFRVLRLARSVKGVQILMAAIAPSVFPAALVCVLLIVVIFVYSVLGMQLFGTAEFDVQRVTFGTIWQAALSCFIVVTGDNWNDILSAGFEVNPFVAPPFFISLFFIGNYIVINLFAAVIIEELDAITNREWIDDHLEERAALLDRPHPPRLIMQPMRARVVEGSVEDMTGKRFSQTSGNGTLARKNSTLPPVKHNSFMGTVDSATKSGEQKSTKKRLVNVVANQLLEFKTAASRLVASDKILQGFSLGCFAPTNGLRVAIAKLTLNKGYIYFSIVVTFANLALIAMQNPDQSDNMKMIQEYSELAFAGYYLLEVLLGCIGRGAISPRKQPMELSDGTQLGGIVEKTDVVESAYFSELGNVLNLFVAVTALLNGLLPEYFKYTRSIRALKLIVFFPSMRIIATAMMRAVPHMAMALLLCTIVWLIFGIFGVSLFKGSLYYCTDVTINNASACRGNFTNPARDPTSIPPFMPLSQENEILEREWRPFLLNFDHLGQSMTTLFSVALQEDWAAIMFLGTDATEPNRGPVYYNNPYVSLYFVAFVVFGNFFTFSLLLGVLINFFIRYKKSSDGTMMLSNEQRLYLLTKRIVDSTMFRFEIQRPTFILRKPFYYIARTTISDIIPANKNQASADEQLEKLSKISSEVQKRVQKRQEEAEKEKMMKTSTMGATGTKGGAKGGAASPVNPASPRGSVVSIDADARAREKQRAAKQVARRVREAKLAELKRKQSDKKAVMEERQSRSFGAALVLEDEPIFDILIGLLTVANGVILAMYSRDMSSTIRTVHEDANIAFAIIYGVEMVVKLIGLAPAGYVADPFNRIDFFATLIIIFGVIFEEQMGNAAYIARIIKLVRLFRFLMNGEAAQKQLATILHGLPSLFNLVFILAVVFFVFGVVGVDLFGNVKLNGALNDLQNFRYLSNAVLVLYQIMSTNNWHAFMQACLIEEPFCSKAEGNCGTLAAYPYFIIFLLLSFIVLLQLCVAIVVEHFEDTNTGASAGVVGGLAELRRNWREVAGSVEKPLQLDRTLVLLLRLPKRMTKIDGAITPQKLFILLYRLHIPLNKDLTISYPPLVFALLAYLYGVDQRQFAVLPRHFDTDLPGPEAFTVGHLLAARIIEQRWHEFKHHRANKEHKAT